MRAIVQDGYGSADDLRLAEIDPPAVADDEVLVRVVAASVHPDVWHTVTGRPYLVRVMGGGLTRPKHPIPGTDMAGIVESVGSDIVGFRPGDEVFGETVRGYTWSNGGAYAEYVAAPAEGLAHKPPNVGFEQAAAIPTAGLIALRAVSHEARVGSGEQVLVNGAGGGVGTIAMQLAKAAGATVTGVDHTSKLDVMRASGADHVIDYTEEDFTRGSARYDAIIDIPGNHAYAECARALEPDGRYVLIGHDDFGRRGHNVLGNGVPRFVGLMVRSPFSRHLKTNFKMLPKAESMEYLRELLGAGSLTTIIDSTFPLEEVPAAINRLAGGASRGRVMISV
jgi:NADPH:quinone reductase-like Zn-dependent oxidoreductase